MAQRLLHELTVVLGRSGRKGADQELGRLGEAAAGFVHRYPEAAELNPAEATPQPEDEATARHGVEHHGLLGHPDRVVPGQHDDHRPELHMARAPGQVGQHRERVGAHRVAGEVMLDRPDRVVTERFCLDGEGDVVLVDGGVLAGVVRSLEDDRVPDVHVHPSRGPCG